MAQEVTPIQTMLMVKVSGYHFWQPSVFFALQQRQHIWW